MANIRLLALEVLLKIEEDNSYSAICLNSVIKDNHLKSLDSSFLTNLVYGVLERKITLDYIIRQYSNIRLKKIEPSSLMILRLGIYQILYMDKVPDSASVNESVKLAKIKKLYKSSGFINGILRSFLRDDKCFDMPKDEVSFLSVKYSCPKEIVSLWIDNYGKEVSEIILKSLFNRPEIYGNMNTLKTDEKEFLLHLRRENVQAEKTLLKNCFSLKNTGDISHLLSFKKGEFYVQDISSQIAVTILDPKKGETIVDVCSAPGGKALASAIKMQNNGKIYAFDKYVGKLSLIKENARRLGVSIIESNVRDAQKDKSFTVKADKVICDVPCDGLGLLRRKPEIRYKENLCSKDLNNLQYDILKNSSRLVKKGGILMYSTCSLNRKENNNIADKFLLENKDFEPFPINLPNGVKRVVDEKENCLTIIPGTINSDGFFISLFKKVGYDD
ncbi:MAG: 16S rRNA (cytosine(967)-C(5))-methyltransferase RsmB [Acutalibacteraceae bacterium]